MKDAVCTGRDRLISVHASWREGSNGRFLILGSVSPALMKQVSESLAGRMGIVELTPLLLEEVGAENLDFLWLNGGFPGGGVLGGGCRGQWAFGGGA